MRVIVTFDKENRTVEVWQKVDGVREIEPYADCVTKLDYAMRIDTEVEIVDGVVKRK